MAREYHLQIGSKLINILKPKGEDLDLKGIEQNLWNARRFSNNPKALVVRQHTRLVRNLAVIGGASPAVIQWSEFHDDHEGIIGDIPGPLKSYLDSVAPIGVHGLHDIELALDEAICDARGIDMPTDETRRKVHVFDKMAETLEWIFVMGMEPQPWNAPWEHLLQRENAIYFAQSARAMSPPPGLIESD